MKIIYKGYPLIVLLIILVVGVICFAVARENTNPIQDEYTELSVEGIVVASPLPNELVTLPLTVEGSIYGNGWFANEGEVGTVELFDANGVSISSKEIVKTTTNWLVLPTEFTALVGDREMMSYITTTTGTLRFTSNGAKNEEVPLTFELPLRFK